MARHKNHPTLKKVIKTRLYYRPQKKNPLLPNRKIKFYLPTISYLKAQKSVKLAKLYKTNLENKRKFKLFFGFYRTTLLKSFLKTKVKNRIKLPYILKELEFCSLLERRLDVLLFRLNFVPSIFAAKQLISHKKTQINNCANTTFSRILKKGDIISFDLHTQYLIQLRLVKLYKKLKFNFLNYNYIEINLKTLKIIVLESKIACPSQLLQYKFSFL